MDLVSINSLFLQQQQIVSLYHAPYSRTSSRPLSLWIFHTDRTRNRYYGFAHSDPIVQGVQLGQCFGREG